MTASSSDSNIVSPPVDVDNQQPAPRRIVSLLPSITEILSSIGVADQIVGITHECDYPPEALEGAEVVTTSEISPYTMSQEEIHKIVCTSLRNGDSLYGINAKALQSVNPDIVFTQSLCDVCAVSYPVVLETCAKIVGGPLSKEGIGPKVISMEPTNLADVLTTIRVAANALDRPEFAETVISQIENDLDTIRNAVDTLPKPKVAFMEWHSPIFTGGHWIPDMVEIAGGEYEMCNSGDRSVAMTSEEFSKLNPEVIIVGPCGFSLEPTIRDTLKMYKKDWWRALKAVKDERVYCVDGNSYYARPGVRLLQGTGIMAACIHGESVASILGDELVPRAGYLRLTVDMYEHIAIEE